MDISSYLGGNYFSQVDLSSPWQVMTIAKVDEQTVGQPPKAEEKICIYFHETKKPLALNKTNLKEVATLYTIDAAKWIGQRLTLYRTTTTFGGKLMPCVRVCGPDQEPPDSILDKSGNPVPFQPPQHPAAAQPQQPVEAPSKPDPWQGQQQQDPPAS